jgi:hypothetical protein
MAAIDDFGSYTVPPSGGCRNAAAVTPSDTVDLTHVSRFLTASGGTTPTIAVNTAGGQTVTIPIVPGYLYPIAATRVLATNTSATGIVAFW